MSTSIGIRERSTVAKLMPSIRLLQSRAASGAERIGPSEMEAPNSQFHSHFCNACVLGPSVCLAGFLCSPCLKAQTLHDMDDSDRLFSLCCVSQVMARSYVAKAYDIETVYPGWQCLGASCAPCCATIQIYAHVQNSNKPDLPPPNESYKTTVTKRLGLSAEDNVCRDPINFLGNAFFSWSESAMLASAMLGTPFWVSYLCSNYCSTHHVFRKNYGVPGEDVYEDCLEPSACVLCCCCSVAFCAECCCPAALLPATSLHQRSHRHRARGATPGLDLQRHPNAGTLLKCARTNEP